MRSSWATVLGTALIRVTLRMVWRQHRLVITRVIAERETLVQQRLPELSGRKREANRYLGLWMVASHLDGRNLQRSEPTHCGDSRGRC